ncbi:MAG: Uncharacterized protein XD55_0992, partial [Thermodesulfobacterium commune]
MREVRSVIRKVIGISVALAVLFAATMPLGSISLAAEKQEVTIYTGSGPGSVYFAIGSMLA